MFYELAQKLRSPLSLARVGFFVANQSYFREFSRDNPDLCSGRYNLLKEWEITNSARKTTVNVESLSDYEQRLGVDSLWPALVSDRRLYLGRNCSFRQDYRPRFDRRQMLTILALTLTALEDFFEQVKPDFVLGFQCVTLGEYLAFLIAKSRGIPVLNLRPTRIDNYVTYGSSIFEPSEQIRRTYQSYRDGSISDVWTARARSYLEVARTKHAMYEGVIPAERAFEANAGSGSPLTRGWQLLKKEVDYRLRTVRDNHDPGVLKPLLYRRLLNPMRSGWNERRLSGSYLPPEVLSETKYVFFPLHTEPEVTLAVYSRAFLNQIEAVRLVSHSIPIEMTVVVKEHPVSVTHRARPLGYYRKLLEIPNVKLADPRLSSRMVVQQSRLVTTIAGSAGLEGLLLGKPAVVLGHVPYEFLPPHMLRAVRDVDTLDREIKQLLNEYRNDEQALLAYVAAVMKESCPVDLYSSLLGRKGAMTSSNPPKQRGAEIERLARYTIDCVQRAAAENRRAE